MPDDRCLIACASGTGSSPAGTHRLPLLASTCA